jgi:uncharacterized protein (DUF488 family)
MKAGPLPLSSARSKTRASSYPRHSRGASFAQKGFCKTRLAAHLTEAGIGYCHLRGLGTPKRGRDAARAGDVESFERIFLAHMDEPEALVDFGEAIALAKDQTVCLLCQRDPEHCHRLIVANRMVAETGRELRHLFMESETTQLG